MRVFLAVALLIGAFALGPQDEALVTLPFGIVVGNMLEASKEFLGIPYADKPDRFVASEGWTADFPGKRLEAKSYSPQCMQPMLPGVKLVANFSEDCLYLNVYTPLGRPEVPWPVMVWIHGGGWYTGSANLPNYNGSTLAAQEKVVVVSMNYRLGVLGFMPTIEKGRVTGNLGFFDQREAMTWIQHHIRAFQGDPQQVTIFGESAGGNSVAMHYVSLGSARLFHRAIVQSGMWNNAVPLATALNNSAAFAMRWGCAGPSDLECLRSLNMTAVVNDSVTGFGPCVDGAFLTAAPLDLILSMKFNQVPLLLGTNSDEGNGLLYPPIFPSKPATPREAKCAFRHAFGDLADRMMDIYTIVQSNQIDNRKAVSEFFSDAFFNCDNREIEQALVKVGVETWGYLFERHSKCHYVDQMGYIPFPGTSHGDEIAYVFNNMAWLASNPASASLKTNNTCINAPEDLALARRVAQLWAGFARTGRMEKAWPQFGDSELKAHLDLGTPEQLDVMTGHRRGQCNALKRLGFTLSGLAKAGDALMDGLLQCQSAPSVQESSNDQSSVVLV